MQTFTKALIDLVLAGDGRPEVAANAATNRHDFLVALERALKQQAVGRARRPPKSREPRRAEPSSRLPELRVAAPAEG